MLRCFLTGPFKHNHKRNALIKSFPTVSKLAGVRPNCYDYFLRLSDFLIYLANYFWSILTYLNPLSTNPTKWSNTLKQFVGTLRLTILWFSRLSQFFNHFPQDRCSQNNSISFVTIHKHYNSYNTLWCYLIVQRKKIVLIWFGSLGQEMWLAGSWKLQKVFNKTST